MATGRDLRARLKLELRDGVSAGLRTIPGRLDRIRSALGRISAVAAVVGGLSLLGPIQQAAAFEDTLRQNAITAGQTGTAVEDMIQRTRRAYETLARLTGQRSQDIAGAAGSLVAAGMSDATIERLMPTIARVATGAAAAMEDMARTTFQMNQQFGITAEQMPQAFASLIQAGREGSFELKDMAREFPALLSAAQSFGLRGQSGLVSMAAALQVVNRNAGSTSQAANNLGRLLSAIASPDVVRNFREMGTNIEGLMRDAGRRGINPLEAVVQRVQELTGGDPFRIGQLFGNEQARDAIVALIQHTRDYLSIRDSTAAAPLTVIDQAFEDRMRGAQAQVVSFTEKLEQLGRRFYLIAGEGLAPINRALDRFFVWIQEVDTEYPGLIDKTLRFGLAAFAVVTSLGGLTWAGGMLMRTLLPLAALMGGPWGLAIAAIATAAVLIYENWDAIVGVFNRVRAAWDRFINSEQMQETGRVFASIGRGIVEVWDTISTAFRLAGEGISTTISTIRRDLQPIFDSIEWLANLLPRLRPEGASGPLAPQGQGLSRPGVASGFYGSRRIPDEEWNAEAVGTLARQPQGNWTGRVVIELPPGVTAREANTNDPRVTIAPDRGATRSRP